MTNIENAVALIHTFASGDVEKAKNLLAEGYIQHNLAYGTGRDAFISSVAALASAPVKTTVNKSVHLRTAIRFSYRQFTTLQVRASKSLLTFSVLTKTARLPSIGIISQQRQIQIPPAEHRLMARWN